eukprot:scaffold25756_cov66-Phaeocystis_antarctica.AAC.4
MGPGLGPRASPRTAGYGRSELASTKRQRWPAARTQIRTTRRRQILAGGKRTFLTGTASCPCPVPNDEHHGLFSCVQGGARARGRSGGSSS